MGASWSTNDSACELPSPVARCLCCRNPRRTSTLQWLERERSAELPSLHHHPPVPKTPYLGVDKTGCSSYRSPRAGTLRWLGADPLEPGEIHGIAPYARVAFEDQFAGGSFSMGAFLLKANLRPGRDRSTGLTDHYTDLGIDTSWLRTVGTDRVKLTARYTHEQRALDATCALGIADGSIAPVPQASCTKGSLHEVRGDVSYYWRNKIGATLGALQIGGDSNASLYSGSRTARPDSVGIVMQVDGTLFGDRDAPVGPRVNMRVGVQYTAYAQFDGARLNYDGAGTNASDNNTVRVFSWIAF